MKFYSNDPYLFSSYSTRDTVLDTLKIILLNLHSNSVMITAKRYPALVLF